MQRLLIGLEALGATLLLGIAVVVVRDFRREPTLTWLNGGEIQVVGYIAIYGGLALLITYLFFVAPLVLLWPLASQRKHWYAMLAAALLWPPAFLAVIDRASPASLLRNMRHSPALYAWLELFAAFGCACYMLLLRAKQER